MDYSALTTSLSESKLDMGAAALCATDERKEVMNFTDVYCDSGQVLWSIRQMTKESRA